MTYEVYMYIFIGAAILAAIMLIVSVILFFALKIPTVIGDLTGANARKAIANIRNQNESSGHKTYQSSVVNRERGKLTDKITPSGRLEPAPSTPLHGAMATSKLNTDELMSNDMAGATVVLDEADSGATTLLEQADTATTLLSKAEEKCVFTVEYQLLFVHSDEVIE